MKTKSLDDLDPKSVRRLANLLSHDLSFRSSEEGLNCIKSPAKWIKDKLLGDAEVSNLVLNDFGCHDDSEFHECFFRNIEGRFEVFEMSENIHYDEDTYMPRNGRFSAVLDLGMGDAVKIDAWGQNGKTMILRDLVCFDSASYDEVVKATAKERFAIFLGIALALAKNGNAALSAEEMLETLERAVAEEPALLSIKQTREIEAALSEPADRPASMIRRSM